MELFNQLIKSPANWIRFELGLVELDGSDYYKEMHYRAKSILKFLLNNSDAIWLIASVSNHIDYKGIDLPNIKRFLRNKNLIFDLKCKTVPFEYDEEDTEMRTIQYSLKVNKEDIRLGYLIKAIGNKEFLRKPRINGNLYIVYIL